MSRVVQMDEVAEIAQVWEAGDEPRCSHDQVDEEYYRTDPTGDVACLNCGDAWPREAARPRPRLR